MTTEATVTLTGRDNLIIHIEGLQATLTKRNARIAELEEQLGLAETGEPQQAALQKAYRRGWKNAAGTLANSVSDAKAALDRVRSVAIEVYNTEDEA